MVWMAGDGHASISVFCASPHPSSPRQFPPHPPAISACPGPPPTPPPMLARMWGAHEAKLPPAPARALANVSMSSVYV